MEPPQRTGPASHDLPGHGPVHHGMTADDAALVQVATDVVRAGSDGARHTVAAAARTTGGAVVTGMNVFHFTGGPCAELVVLGAAAAHSSSTVDTIVAVGDQGRGVLAPCGRCRQVLLDLHPGARVLVPLTTGAAGGVAVATTAQLLPGAYTALDATTPARGSEDGG